MTQKAAYAVLCEQLAMPEKKAREHGWRYVGRSCPQVHLFALQSRNWTLTVAVTPKGGRAS